MDSVRRSIQVVVVAPALLRWGLERLIQGSQPQVELAGAVGSHTEALELIERRSVDVVVLAHDDLAVESIAGFCGRSSAHVLVVTASRDTTWLDGAVMAGVRGVARLDDPPAVFLKAIVKVHEGELWIDRSATSRIFLEMARHKAAGRDDPERSKIAALTLRERQTIAALASDASAPGKVIADRLCISEHTLRNHLTSIYNKLGLSNRVDLYAYATRHSLHEMR
jgi:two-component system, NarL family, nitrate/nitrite response regulator NarL